MIQPRATLMVTLLLVRACIVSAFQPLPTRTWTLTSTGALDAKKGGKSKGFGNVPAKTEAPKSPSIPAETLSANVPSPDEPARPKGAFLQSVEGGTTQKPAVDESLPPEERAKQLLRDKYGMKTLEEQQAKEKQMQQIKAQQKKLAELKRKAELDEDIDLIAMIPAPVLKGLDNFLKAGVAISGLAFILAGFAITAEAWSKASGQALPEDIDKFIVNVVEPNFTPGLLVVLGFSISLGVLAAASLGSEGAQYREK